MWMIVANVVTMVLGLIFPQAPKWIGTALTKAIPAIIEGVRELKNHTAAGSDKKSATIEALREYLDTELDTVEGWKDMTEESRDKLIDGMIECIWFVVKHEEAGAEAQHLAEFAPKHKFDILSIFKKLHK